MQCDFLVELFHFFFIRGNIAASFSDGGGFTILADYGSGMLKHFGFFRACFGGSLGRL